MRVKEPVFRSFALSHKALCGILERSTFTMESGGKDGRERLARISLLFVGYLMIVTNASIGVAFCLGLILLTESVISEWSLME